MLILSRKPHQSIVIEGGITVTLLAVQGNGVRIGIEAPKATPVHRGEVAERIRQEETSALPAQKQRPW